MSKVKIVKPLTAKPLTVGLLTDARRWSRRTFGPGERTEGVLRHIEQEIAEVREHPDDLFEWADLIILAIDGAQRRGFLSSEILNAVRAKYEINFARTWPDWRESSEDEPINHVGHTPVVE